MASTGAWYMRLRRFTTIRPWRLMIWYQGLLRPSWVRPPMRSNFLIAA